MDLQEILLKMAESGVEKAAAEVTSTCPLAVTLTKREMSRRNFSQSLLTLDVDAPEEPTEAEKDQKTENKRTEEKEEKEQKDKENQEDKEETDLSTTVASERKETKEEVTSTKDSKEETGDVVVTQTPMDLEEYEEELKVPDVRGVPLKHITLLGQF